MTGIVRLEAGVPVASTLDLWKGLEVEHIALMQLIKKYNDSFQSIRTFHFLKSKSTGGRPSEYCMLDEEQVTFLVTLMRNSKVVVPFKLRLTREFYRMKQELIRIASQNQNAEHLAERTTGKEIRKISTDSIKTFIDYAENQGSTQAKKYYINITSMENRALFLLDQKYPNLRDVLNIQQLGAIKAADMIVMKALNDGMAQKLHYTDIYKLAKVRVESFAEIIGKSIVPHFSNAITNNAEPAKQLTQG